MSPKNSTLSLAVLSSVLVLMLFALGAYTYNDYRQDKLDEKELAIQKKAMESELSEMVTNYENVQALNGVIDGHLLEAKLRIVSLLDTIRMNEPKLHLLMKFRRDIELLKTEKERLFTINDSLLTENNKMKLDLNEQDLVINNTENLKNILIKENKKLLSLVSNNKKIRFSSLTAQAIRIKKNGKTSITSKFKRTDAIKACFKIKENASSTKENKNVYIKVINPNSELLGNVIKRVFNGDTIEYSAEKKVFYSKEELRVCFHIKPDEEKLVAGTYTFQLFQDHALKGASTFKLE